MIKVFNIQVANDLQLLKWLKESRAIYDKSLFILRQFYFSTKIQKGKIWTPNYNQLYNLVKTEQVFKNSTLEAATKAQVIRQVSNVWKSFIKSVITYKANPDKFIEKPKIPKYLYKNSDYNIVIFDKNKIRKKTIDLINHTLELPKLKGYKIKLPKDLDINSIRQISVQKYYNKIKINIIYEQDDIAVQDLDYSSVIGIDIGLNNLCAITSNDKQFSYVIKGGPLKSINQFYNKYLAEMKSELEKCNKKKNSKRINSLSLKRKNKIDDYMHKASRRIIDLCLESRIGRIVVGHNDGWKQNINLGKRNNQNFVSIPFNRLISLLKYKAEEKGILFESVEESYTSKIDHLSLESLCKQKTYSGQRIKRGLFKSGIGKVINADINGAIGILRKANGIWDDQLLVLQDRGDVVSPEVLKIA